MAFTRGQWVNDFLHAIGNNNPVITAIWFVGGWSTFETSHNLDAAPRFNLLATTQVMGKGETSFNSVGVKNYPDYATGVQANSITIRNGRYNTILAALRNNDVNKLNNPTPAMISELNTWGTGYRTNFVNLGVNSMQDTAHYGSGTTVGVPPFTGNEGANMPPNPPVLPEVKPPVLLPEWINQMYIGKMAIGVLLIGIGAYLLLRGSK